mmetsp:Transcript_11062/g.41261  ORF Transcript_11062/g.41261 Transcript_11062/m.41261 type:complete len:220 (+) Transcript_11062:3499-4158(+)
MSGDEFFELVCVPQVAAREHVMLSHEGITDATCIVYLPQRLMQIVIPHDNIPLLQSHGVMIDVHDANPVSIICELTQFPSQCIKSTSQIDDLARVCLFPWHMTAVHLKKHVNHLPNSIHPTPIAPQHEWVQLEDIWIRLLFLRRLSSGSSTRLGEHHWRGGLLWRVRDVMCGAGLMVTITRWRIVQLTRIRVAPLTTTTPRSTIHKQWQIRILKYILVP